MTKGLLAVLFPVLVSGAVVSACAGETGIHPAQTVPFPSRYCDVDGPNGELDRVRCVMDANKGAIYAIYRRHLVQSPRLSGKIIFAIHLLEDGTARAVTVEKNDTGDARLGEEIADLLARTNFGPGPRAVTIRYPIDFLPS